METEKKNGFGIAALVLGIIGILTSCIGIGIVFDIFAIIFGLISIISPKQKSGLGIAGLVIAICSIIIILFVGNVFFDDSDKGEISNSATEEVEKKDNTSSSISDSDFEITEYSYGNTIGDSIYIVVVKNNSSETVDISADATAFDESGNKLGLSNDDIFALESGKSYPLKFYFDGVSASSYEYKLNYSKSNSKSKLSSLSFTETQNDGNVIIDCTNNSDEDIEFPQAFVIFFNGDEIVSSDYTYLNGDDMILRAGDTQSAEIDCYDTFDRYEAFYIAQ